MERRLLWALVVVNVLLAASLALRFGRENTAVAQVHRPADYVLIPGEVAGGASAVVYMVDTTNGWLGAMAYDDARNVLNTMPPIDLARVFQTGPAAGAAVGPGARPNR
jgi:hypothetical protein